MRRAACLIAVALGALGANAPLPSVAQEARRVFRIGILSPAARPDTAIFDAFRKGLADLGYFDGQNIRAPIAGNPSRKPSAPTQSLQHIPPLFRAARGRPDGLFAFGVTG
jgi:hypothetical protein